MLWRFSLVFAVFLSVCGSAEAQTVPPAPAPTADPVAEEQHSPQVGDVIMAPAIEGPEDEPDVPGAPLPKPQPRRWYGAPILIGDVVAYASIGLAAGMEGTASVALPIGIGAFLLTGPITHGRHHQWTHLGLSLASRTALPFAGLLLGAYSCSADSNCSPALIGGLVGVGMAAATIVDVAVLPYEPVPEALTVQPLVSLSRERLWLGAGGTF